MGKRRNKSMDDVLKKQSQNEAWTPGSIPAGTIFKIDGRGGSRVRGDGIERPTNRSDPNPKKDG